MNASALTLKALGARISRPGRALRNRVRASRSRLGTRPKVSETLPEPVMLGDADRGQALVGGQWSVFGRTVQVGSASIWDAPAPEPKFEDARQSCLWLDDLAALGSRPARLLAQSWVQDWIRRYGSGGGPGWTPEIAGRRAKRWTAHSRMLAEGLDRTARDRFWFALASQQRYLKNTWEMAPTGVPQLRALTGLLWSGLVLPNQGQPAALASIGTLADTLIDASGATGSRSPEDLAEILILLIWSARLLEDAGQHPAPAQLAAIARAVPVLRMLRMGDGSLARFQGGGAGPADDLDHALAELRLGVQAKPKLPMGYARLAGGRVIAVMDGAAPPETDSPGSACAGTLAFEMSIGRQPVVVNAGPGGSFGSEWSDISRQTAAHSTVEVGARSSARLITRGLAARAFGARLEDGPSLVSVKQAQDATGMWLLATHDGYASTSGLLHERRIFVDARGGGVRGEDIPSVSDARAKAVFDKASRRAPVEIAARFHLHPEIQARLDEVRRVVVLELPDGEAWTFQAAGGFLELEDSIYLDPANPEPVQTKQMVVRAEAVEYLGQVTWSFSQGAESKTA